MNANEKAYNVIEEPKQIFTLAEEKKNTEKLTYYCKGKKKNQYSSSMKDYLILIYYYSKYISLNQNMYVCVYKFYNKLK